MRCGHPRRGRGLHERHGEPVTARTIGDGVVGTHAHALEAYDTARCVDGVAGQVDTLGLAHAAALAAVDTLVGVNIGMEHSPLADAAEERPDGAYSVAQEPSAPPRHADDKRRRSDRRSERGKRERHGRTASGKRRRHKLPDDAGISAVGVEEHGDEHPSAYHAGHDHDDDREPQAIAGRMIAIAPGAATAPRRNHAPERRHAVLKRTQRTHRRAVYTPADEGHGNPHDEPYRRTRDYSRHNLHAAENAVPAADKRHRRRQQGRERHDDADYAD